MIYETTRLIVRDWRDEDAADAFEIYREPEVNKGILGQEPESVEVMRQRLRSIRERYANLNGMGVWAVELKSEMRVVATCLLKPLPDSELIEVGWHVGVRDWRKGIASEFGRGALNYGFNKLGLEEIYAIVFPWNTASRRVCEKLGMIHLGQTREFHHQELEFYKISRINWR